MAIDEAGALEATRTEPSEMTANEPAAAMAPAGSSLGWRTHGGFHPASTLAVHMHKVLARDGGAQ